MNKPDKCYLLVIPISIIYILLFLSFYSVLLTSLKYHTSITIFNFTQLSHHLFHHFCNSMFSTYYSLFHKLCHKKIIFLISPNQRQTIFKQQIQLQIHRSLMMIIKKAIMTTIRLIIIL